MLDNALRETIGRFQCSELDLLVRAAAPAAGRRARQGVRRQDERQPRPGPAGDREGAQRRTSPATSAASTSRTCRSIVSAVRLPDAVQKAVDEAQAQFAEVNKSRADLQRAKIRKQVNDTLGALVRELPGLRGDRRAEVDPRQRHRDLARWRRVDRAERLQEVVGVPRPADPLRDRLDGAQRRLRDPPAAPRRRRTPAGRRAPARSRAAATWSSSTGPVSRCRRSGGSPATSAGSSWARSSRRGCRRPRRGRRRSTRPSAPPSAPRRRRR